MATVWPARLTGAVPVKTTAVTFAALMNAGWVEKARAPPVAAKAGVAPTTTTAGTLQAAPFSRVRRARAERFGASSVSMISSMGDPPPLHAGRLTCASLTVRYQQFGDRNVP